MHFGRNFSTLGVALAGVLALLAAGCNKPPEERPATPASASIGTQIGDTVVTARVKSALLADPDIKSFDLKVETRKGVVHLSSYVDNQAQIDLATLIARKVEGVTSVSGEMSVKK